MFPVIDRQADTVFYVINYDPKGFIVLAADQRSIPILAFTPNNSFKTNADRFPYGLVKWLVKTRDDINYIRDNNLGQKPRIAEMWKNLNYERYQDPMVPSDGYDPSDPCEITYDIVNPLLNTYWSQRCGYNDSMPVLSYSNACYYNNNVLAGCVPIAVAQIMKYHEYPNNYNWNNMLPDDGTYTTASFIRDIWDAVPASGKTFNCDGTGVYTNYIPGVFINDFNYSSASLAGYNYHTVEQQLNLGRPVILSGGRRADEGWWIFHDYYTDGAHAWVCDGYIEAVPCPGVMGSVVLHMNWGWGGLYNAWYGINDFTPGNDYYSYGEEMIYNIIP